MTSVVCIVTPSAILLDSILKGKVVPIALCYQTVFCKDIVCRNATQCLRVGIVLGETRMTMRDVFIG